ncbi:MAG: hypothetical protein WAN46_04185 [Gammaproteobacteria bacterium]
MVKSDELMMGKLKAMDLDVVDIEKAAAGSKWQAPAAVPGKSSHSEK